MYKIHIQRNLLAIVILTRPIVLFILYLATRTTLTQNAERGRDGREGGDEQGKTDGRQK